MENIVNMENKMPEIQAHDLIKVGAIYEVFKCTQEENDCIPSLHGYLGKLYYDCSLDFNSGNNWVCTVEKELESGNISAIYRKQGEDYMCIWSKKN